MFSISEITSPVPAFALDGKPVHGSQAVAVAGEYTLVWTSGQVAPKGPRGRGAIEEQVRQVLEQLGDVARAAGGDLGNVVKLMAWLPQREHVAAYAEIRKEFFGQASPASTSVISELVEPDMLIEVEAILAIPTEGVAR